jgi:hypothetical protein
MTLPSNAVVPERTSKVPAVTLGFWIVKILAFMVVCILVLPQRAGQHPEAKASA